MNSRERVFTTIHHKEPDRVPIGEALIDERIREALYPQGSLLDFLELIDLDVVFAYRGRGFRSLGSGFLQDEWGVVFRETQDQLPHPIRGPLESVTDLDEYHLPDPTEPYMFAALSDMVARFKGQRAIGYLMLDVFSIPCYLRGMDNFLMDLIERPDYAHQLVDMVTEYQLILLEEAIRRGAEIIQCSCDYAHRTNTFISPEQFKEFFQPGLKRMVDRTHDLGGYFLKHSDGNLWPILDMLIDTGIDILQSLQPDAGMDIGRVKQEYGNDVCLMGNIDCGHVLSEAPVQEVRETVRKCVADAGPGGGFILSSSNSIHSAVKPENYRAMLEAGREYGRYQQ